MDVKGGSRTFRFFTQCLTSYAERDSFDATLRETFTPIE